MPVRQGHLWIPGLEAAGLIKVKQTTPASAPGIPYGLYLLTGEGCRWLNTEGRHNQ